MKNLNVAEFIEEAFERKKLKAPHLSIRAAALRLEMSPSTISRILQGKRKISLDTAEKLAHWLKLSAEEKIYLRNLVLYEMVESPILKEELFRTICYSPVSITLVDENPSIDINETLKMSRVTKIYTYIDHSNRDHRSLYRLQNEKNNELSPSFYDIFFSLERSAASAGYFLANTDGNYRAYLDILTNNPQATFENSIHNRNLKVEFQAHFPRIIGVTANLLKKEKFGLLDICFSQEQVIVEGEIFDRLNSDFKENYSRKYERVN